MDKFKIIGFNNVGSEYHILEDSEGKRFACDILVSGCFHEQTEGMNRDAYELFCRSLIGKEVEYEWSAPYISIAHGVKINL